MKKLPGFLAFSVLALSANALPAQAFSVAPSSMTDSEFNGLINSRQFTELFVAESRAGNGSLSSAERELGINQPVLPVIGGGLPFPGAQGQFAWGSNQPVDFVLSYDNTTGGISYQVADQTLTANVDPGSDPNSIFLRTRAQPKDANTLSSSLILQSLLLTDDLETDTLPALASFFTQGEDPDIDYLIVSDVVGSFTLTGQQVFSWEGTFPDRSRLATQFKVGTFNNVDPVPEPLTILGTAAAAGFGIVLKRRRAAQDS